MSNLERKTLKSKVASSDDNEDVDVVSLPERDGKVKIVDSGKPNTCTNCCQQNENGPKRVVKPENSGKTRPPYNWSQLPKNGPKRVIKPENGNSGKPSTHTIASLLNENGPKSVVEPEIMDSGKPSTSGNGTQPFGLVPYGNCGIPGEKDVDSSSAPLFTIGSVPLTSAPRRHRSAKVATPDENKDSAYLAMRKKNNASAKKSRDTKNKKMAALKEETEFLEKEHIELTAKLEAKTAEYDSLERYVYERQMFVMLVLAEMQKQARIDIMRSGTRLE